MKMKEWVNDQMERMNFTDNELYQIHRLIDVKPITLITGNDDDCYHCL